jgi:hypothetical protein
MIQRPQARGLFLLFFFLSKLDYAFAHKPGFKNINMVQDLTKIEWQTCPTHVHHSTSLMTHRASFMAGVTNHHISELEIVIQYFL